MKFINLKRSYLLLKGIQLDIENCDQFQHHGTGNSRVAGTQKHAFRVFRIGVEELGVIVTCQEEAARGRGVKHSQDVGEGDQALRSGGREGVLLDCPARQ